MEIKNEWVGYLTRSHLQIKNSLLNRLGQRNPEITDHSESNMLVIIISMFSGIAEMLNYYIDNMAREAFITTARRYSSVVKHTRLIDYRIKAAIASSADITIEFRDEDNNPIPTPVAFTLPKNTLFTTTNNIPFISTKDIMVNPGSSSVLVPTEQKTLQENLLIGNTNGDSDQVLALDPNYVHDSIFLTIGGETWELVNTLGLSGPNDKHYIIDISVDKVAYIRFGDNVNGAIPDANLEVIGDLYTTLAEEGNVDIDTINTTAFDFTTIPGFTIGTENIHITNKLASTGGTGYENIDRIRRSAPLSLRTLDRAVTKQDYKDIALLAPGVDKSSVHFNCGKYVDVYVSPIGGGIAQIALLDNTKAFIEDRKMITTFINVSAAGESYIVMDIEATTKFRRDGAKTHKDIVNALLENYNYASSTVNRGIRLSDIIALVDNLEKVDYLTLNEIYLKPYLRPKLHNVTINNDIVIRKGSIAKVKWKIQYDGTYMRLYKEGIFQANLAIGVTHITPDNIMAITIQPGAYTAQQEWEFTTHPYNLNIETEDFSVPVLRQQDIQLKVNEQFAI